MASGLVAKKWTITNNKKTNNTMGTYIVIAILFILFIAAAFVAARLDDKLQKERNLTKNLLNNITELKAQIKILETK